jgi:CheY-like chemotaxis protein
MDDEELVRGVLTRMLHHLGFEVDTAREGRQAVEMYEHAHHAGEQYELVIMDMTVPGGQGGKEAVREILRVEPGARVVVASGYSNDPVMSDYRDHGFAGAIHKPIVLAELARTLRNVLRP